LLREFEQAKATLEIGLCTVLTPVPKEVLEEMEANAQAPIPSEKKLAETPPVSKEATKKSDYNFGMEVA
jgi:hypothetical protein